MGSALAQTPAPAKKAPVSPAAAAKAPSAGNPSTPAAAPSVRSGKGWKTGAMPAWVVEPPATQGSGAPPSGPRHEQLVDFQSNYLLPKPQLFVRIRSVARETGGLGSVSQPQISFNPAYQTVVLHSAAVVREGKRQERLAEVRIESMRREQRLEQQMMDGSDTLLVLLNDVRVGDAVEVAYTVEGENPIFEGRISTGMRLAYETPADVIHHRVMAPAARTLHTKGLVTDLQPERLSEGGHQVLRMVRHQVPALPLEQGTPPWFKVYPAVDISEYAQWAEVDAWAQRLFALPQPTPASVVAKAAALREKGLQGEALLSEAVRFVQDEVRYFSMSLGESSHRPKPPQQTLADLLGDCKDKVTLLNALLRELGFDAKPVLVSMQRNRGILDYLPSHDVFDHVISRVDLDGKSWYLDATAQGQGTQLATRGQVPFGAALVVGGATALTRLPEPSASTSQMQFEQLWNLAQPGKPVQFETVLRAVGAQAERMRATVSAATPEQLTQGLSASFARVLPSMKTLGPATVVDDRAANRIELRQRMEVPEFGQYNRGHVDTEFLALEMLDVLNGPAETQRRSPYWVDHPRSVEHRVVITGPAPFTFTPPPQLEVADKQFRYSVRMDTQGPTATYLRRYERREDQVLPAELAAWREKVIRARQTVSGTLRLPLINAKTLMPELEALERRLRSARGWRQDDLQDILTRNEFGKLIDTRALEKVEAGSSLAAKVLASRAQAQNLLGEFAHARQDAEAALKALPENADALEALAVAQVGEGKVEQALATFGQINPQARSASIASWMASLHLHLGRPAEAEALYKQAVATGSGEGREFALIGLYLAAERQGAGRGKAAVADDVEGVDAKKLTGAVLRFYLGSVDQAGLLKVATEKAASERLYLAEAHYYIGQRLLLMGLRDEALRTFERVLETKATPYREVTFAQLELKRAGK